MMWMFAFKF